MNNNFIALPKKQINYFKYLIYSENIYKIIDLFVVS